MAEDTIGSCFYSEHVILSESIKETREMTYSLNIPVAFSVAVPLIILR